MERLGLQLHASCSFGYCCGSETRAPKEKADLAVRLWWIPKLLLGGGDFGADVHADAFFGAAQIDFAVSKRGSAPAFA